MLDLEDGPLPIPGHTQKDYAADTFPSHQTFALDRSGTLRTVKTLQACLNHRDAQRGRKPLRNTAVALARRSRTS
jgi:hypothetical protein